MHRPFSIVNTLDIEKNHAVFLNPRRIELLKLIQKHGSILAASKALKMSYQQAWTVIRDINSTAALPVVSRQRGGAGGGGAEITDYGCRLIERYDLLRERFRRYLNDLDDDLQNLCSF
ncbi:MAG: LysR family transcriptional regulator [Candidatus Symbiothrix sp.]|nr:LysR family transcriptional regulator [Candidatus Symbiothrix sp.]